MRISDWSSDVCSSDLTAASTSQYGTITIGMNRSGAAAHHSSMMKSFQALTQALASSLSDPAMKVDPAKPGNEGKHIWAWMPSRSMSARRACTPRSEEHTPDLQSLMPISYAVSFLKNKSHKYYI